MNIGNTYFNNIILNASGCWCKTDEQLTILNNTLLGGIVSKTTTLHEKNANKEPNYITIDKNIKMNCMGIPNNGYEYYKKYLYTFIKPYILSLCCNNLNELKYMLNDYNEYSKLYYNTTNTPALVELNISCPNVGGRIKGYHIKDIISILKMIDEMKLKYIQIGLKLPPYSEIEKIIKLSKVFYFYNIINILVYIVCSNSIPNGLYLKNNKPYLSNIYGGISGGYNKYISLSNVYTFNTSLSRLSHLYNINLNNINNNINNNNIKIIGCGGIKTIDDIKEYVTCGASFVQIGSFINENNINVNEINNLCNVVNV